MFEWVKEAAEEAARAVAEAAAKAADAAREAAEAAAEAVRKAADEAIEAARRAAEATVADAEQAARDAGDAVGRLGNEVADAAQAVGEGAIDAAAEFTDRVSDWLSDTIGAILTDPEAWVRERLDDIIDPEDREFDGPIAESVIQPASGIARETAEARSVISESPPAARPFHPEGRHRDYRLTRGRAHERLPDGSEPLIAPHYDDDVPPWGKDRISPALAGAVKAGTAALAVSYDTDRLGTWDEPPAFEMLAASGDRLIAKAMGTDEMFVCITGYPFAHDAEGGRVLLPQSYFKLDPEVDRAGAVVADLERHLEVPGDDERHPATERYPLFRWVFDNTPTINKTPLAFEQMNVQFRPRIWHKVDLRPPQRTEEPQPPSAIFPTYEHVRYGGPDGGWKRSIAFDCVLDLGVGLTHLHEQHDHRFGGEVDALSYPGNPLIHGPTIELLFGGSLQLPSLMTLLGVPVDDVEDAYQLANGQIRDFGGWLDGTCIYYLLVQLKEVRAGFEQDPEARQDAFAVLWSDEQFAFNERWRAVDIRDAAFVSPIKPAVSALGEKPDDFHLGQPFKPDRFWNPCEAGCVTLESRMAVARQLIVLSGTEFGIAPPRHELYTIHFAWGNMDKTWRWRGLPATATALKDLAGATTDAVVPGSVRIREDTTILLRGARRVAGATVTGWWYQRYLPADGQEQPSLDALRHGPPGKPSVGFSHAWDFVVDDPFEVMHGGFSHFGVLEPVDGRVQAYLVEITSAQGPGGAPLTDADLEGSVWTDTQQALVPSHRRLDWSAAARVLRGRQPFQLRPSWFGALVDAFIAVRDSVVPLRSYPTAVPLELRLRKRGTLGWILLHDDPRNEKLDVVWDPSTTLTLTSGGRTVAMQIKAYKRNDPDRHGLTVAVERDSVSPPQVREAAVRAVQGAQGSVAEVQLSFTLARDPSATNGFDTWEQWVDANVWRVRLAAVGAGGAVIDLLDVARATLFTPDAAQKVFTGSWIPSAADQRGGLLSQLLSDEGHVRHGTSLWFVGATGLAAPPEATTFEARRPAPAMRLELTAATLQVRRLGLVRPTVQQLNDEWVELIAHGDVALDRVTITHTIVDRRCRPTGTRALPPLGTGRLRNGMRVRVHTGPVRRHGRGTSCTSTSGSRHSPGTPAAATWLRCSWTTRSSTPRTCRRARRAS